MCMEISSWSGVGGHRRGDIVDIAGIDRIAAGGDVDPAGDGQADQRDHNGAQRSGRGEPAGEGAMEVAIALAVSWNRW